VNHLVELHEVAVAVDLVPIISAVSLHLDPGGGGAVLVSHDAEGLSGLADRMLTLRSGALEGAA
jgi:hypothetical protein